MELNVVKPGNEAAGTVAVSEANFAREYNEALVHQVVTAYLQALVRVRVPRRQGLRSPVVARSHGVRKALVALAREPSGRPFGAQVA